MKGPDLLGVEQKYSQEWLINFIRSANTMIDNGDPQAIAIYEKFNKQNMVDTDLPTSDIIALLNYIKSFNESPVTENNKKIISQNINKTDDLTGTIQQPTDKPFAEQEYNRRLNDIEKKLDMLLEFHKQSMSARITDEEVEKGRKLFEGEIRFTENVPACVNCHNNIESDTLNWNPSAYDIAKAFSRENDVDMINLIINPVSAKMKEVLNGNKLTDDESFYITAYLEDLAKNGLQENRKFPLTLISFILISLLFVLFLFDLVFSKIIKPNWIHLILLSATSAYIINVLYQNATKIGLSQNYAPDQPIKFSHKVHVKENDIDCLFCHNSPEFSRESGIPTTNVCMICHNRIRTGKMTGQFEINKIRESYDKNKPIEWIKIHNLPDHVFFSHAQHFNIGKIACNTCHGPVEEMDITRQYASLSMGWCIQCHRETEVQFETNQFYANYVKLQNDLKNGKIDKVTADEIGANDCQKCHY